MKNEMTELKSGMVVKFKNNKNNYVVLTEDRVIKKEIEKVFKLNLNELKIELIWECKPEVDWSKVAVDTKVLVRYSDSEQWGKRYFAKYENNIPFVFEDGCTSFNAGKTDNWFREVRQIVLYEGNESLVGE